MRLGLNGGLESKLSSTESRLVPDMRPHGTLIDWLMFIIAVFLGDEFRQVHPVAGGQANALGACRWLPLLSPWSGFDVGWHGLGCSRVQLTERLTESGPDEVQGGSVPDGLAHPDFVDAIRDGLKHRELGPHNGLGQCFAEIDDAARVRAVAVRVLDERVDVFVCVHGLFVSLVCLFFFELAGSDPAMGD